MRSTVALITLAVLAGCGGHRAAPVQHATPAGTSAGPAATAVPQHRHGPWSAPVPSRWAPPRCPVSSTRLDRLQTLRPVPFPHVEAGPVQVAPGRLTGIREGTPPELAALAPDGTRPSGAPLAGAGNAVPRIACAQDGRVAVAWVEPDGETESRLRLAFQDPGGALGPARTLAQHTAVLDQPGVGAVALAFGPVGELVVAYVAPYKVRAVAVSASGAPGRAVTLGRASEVTSVVSAAARNGRAVVAWTTQDAGEERDEPHRVYAAVRAPRAGAFAPAQTVDPGAGVDPMQFSTDPRAGIRLAVVANGRALVEWGTVSGRSEHYHHPVRVAEAPPNGSFGAPHRLALDGTQGDVAVRADGTALATWIEHGRVRAAVHTRGAAFRHTETVSDREQVHTPAAAFGAGGAPQLTWIDHAGTRRSVLTQAP